MTMRASSKYLWTGCLDGRHTARINARRKLVSIRQGPLSDISEDRALHRNRLNLGTLWTPWTGWCEGVRRLYELRVGAHM